jgi:hypothetical protein
MLPQTIAEPYIKLLTPHNIYVFAILILLVVSTTKCESEVASCVKFHTRFHQSMLLQTDDRVIS